MFFQFGFCVWIIAGFVNAIPLKIPRLKAGSSIEGIKLDDGEFKGKDESVTDQISVINSETDVDLFEGDIMLIDIDKDKVDLRDEGDVDGESSRDRYKRNVMRDKRNVMRDKQALWSNREVPYEFHSSIPVSYHSTVMAAIDEFHLKTCLKFKPRTNQSNWIVFIHKQGCWSTVGKKYWRVNYGQELSLGPSCNNKATIIHELMHAIGFWHEHSRTDRNQYVEVLWENIIEDKAHDFNRYKHDMVHGLHVPYDYDSIMQYGRKQFSKNGEDTIRALRDPNRPLGTTQGFSPTDLQEVNSMYDCKNTGVPGWSSWSGFGPCSLYCKKERQRYCFSDNPAVDCPGNHAYNVETETVVCNHTECYAPVDGHWGRWSSWSNCTSCGPGSQMRTRQCDDPPPKNGGSNCMGNSTQSRACYLRRCGLGPDDCEFDYDGFCFWKNEQNSLYTFDWLRGTGATPSKNTGPTADHTTGTGHYLYIESSSPAQPGYKARIISKTFPPTSVRCLSFWYHMRGSSIGELNVYSQTKEDGLRKLWSRVGEQGSTWQQAKVTLLIDSNYELIFEAIRGKSFNGDIAIDDVKFREHPCMESLGCFRDGSPHAIPELLGNLRPGIDWFNMNKTINECARLTHLKGYKIFGIQFYGECWSGNTSQVQHDKYGVASDSKCWAGVGGPEVYYVYRIL